MREAALEAPVAWLSVEKNTFLRAVQRVAMVVGVVQCSCMADKHLYTLLDLRYNPHQRAPGGEAGQGNNRAGKRWSGPDITRTLRYYGTIV